MATQEHTEVEQAGAEGRTIISSWVPVSVARELQVMASREDRLVSAEIRRAINFHLQRQDGGSS